MPARVVRRVDRLFELDPPLSKILPIDHTKRGKPVLVPYIDDLANCCLGSNRERFERELRRLRAGNPSTTPACSIAIWALGESVAWI